MNRIAQEAAFRLAVVRYAERHGPSQAAIKYRVSRMTVYHWRKRYDGTKESHRKDNEEFDASHQFDSFGISRGSWLGAIESAMHSRCVHWAGIHQTDV